MYQIILRLIPKKIRNHVYEILALSRMRVHKERFLGVYLITSFFVSLAIALFVFGFFHINISMGFFSSFIVLLLGFYFTFSLKADATAKFVERVLPDALQLMSSNLRAGLTTDKALLLSARPEFGVLSEEINGIGKKIALGEDIGVAMMDMTKQFRSDKLRKTFYLVVTGLRSGGELTDLLDQTAENLRQEQFLDEKIRTNVLMYVIFIFSAIGVGAPILFGLSSFLVGVIERNLSLVELPDTAAISLPITFSETPVPASFVILFAIVSLVTTSILGSLVLGLIAKGKEIYGIKFIPILVIMTLSIFFLTRFLIGLLLGDLFSLS